MLVKITTDITLDRENSKKCKFRFSVLAHSIYKKIQNEREYKMSIVMDAVMCHSDASRWRDSFSQVAGILAEFLSGLTKVYSPFPRGSLLRDSRSRGLALLLDSRQF